MDLRRKCTKLISIFGKGKKIGLGDKIKSSKIKNALLGRLELGQTINSFMESKYS